MKFNYITGGEFFMNLGIGDAVKVIKKLNRIVISTN